MTAIDSNTAGGKLRNIVAERMRATTQTAEEVSSHLGYHNEHMIAAFLKGLTKLPLDRLRALSQVLEVEFAILLEAWLNDCLPVLISLPEVMVVTPEERRLLEKVRAHYPGNTASLVVADGRDLVAVVMA